MIDTSVFTDFFINFSEDRHRKARLLFDRISEADFIIYEPFIFEIELAGILRRRFNEAVVSEIIENLKDRIVILDELSLHRVAFDVAMKTHCRAVDAYFIAAAESSNTALITNDRIMANNAKKSNIDAYYLIDEFSEAIERLESL